MQFVFVCISSRQEMPQAQQNLVSSKQAQLHAMGLASNNWYRSRQVARHSSGESQDERPCTGHGPWDGLQ